MIAGLDVERSFSINCSELFDEEQAFDLSEKLDLHPLWDARLTPNSRGSGSPCRQVVLARPNHVARKIRTYSTPLYWSGSGTLYILLERSTAALNKSERVMRYQAAESEGEQQ